MKKPTSLLITVIIISKLIIYDDSANFFVPNVSSVVYPVLKFVHLRE